MSSPLTTPLAKLLSLVGQRAPRALSARFAQASRDASVLERRLLHGHAPSPLVDRGPRHPRPPRVVAPPIPAEPSTVRAADGRTLITVRDGEMQLECAASPDQYVLAATLEAGVSMPFSCALGGCGSCKVLLVSGEYEMDEPHCLTDEERGAGFVLTCVGRAKSPCTLEIVR